MANGTAPTDQAHVVWSETVLEDTANPLAKAPIDVPSWKNWNTCATSVGSRYHLKLAAVTLILAKHKTSERIFRKDKEGKLSAASTCETIAFHGCLIVAPFSLTQSS